MVDIPALTIFNFFFFLLPPFIFGMLAKRLKISPIVGYIIGGLILGNFFDGFISKDTVNQFAYFGIILLLFTVGLEINFSRLLTLKRYIIIGGTLQLLLSIFFIFILSLLFKFGLLQSFLISIALSSSSTALVAKIIQDRGEENSFVGEIALGILMYQNIAFIPFLIIFTSITSDTVSVFNIGLDIILGLLKSVVIIFLLYYVGQKAIPVIFNKISRMSRELLNLFIIVFIFFITYISLVLGIPILIGVFVAGVLLAHTVENHHIFSEVRPLRDLFAVVFFVFIGINIKLAVIFTLIPAILAFTFLLILIKGLIVFGIFLSFRFHPKTSFSLGSYLFQVDEDVFILMSVVFISQVVSFSEYLFVITSALISFMLTPIVIKNKDIIYSLIRRTIKKHIPFLDKIIVRKFEQNHSPLDVLNIKNHIVICGYGRMGSNIGRTLLLSDIPFIAIDYDFQKVEQAKKEGVNIIYGDASDIDLLDYIQVDEAIILILAVPEKISQESIILNAKKLNPKIYIISRIHQKQDKKRIKEIGADMLIQPEFEASLSIIKKILMWYHLPKEEILSRIKTLKIEQGLI